MQNTKPSAYDRALFKALLLEPPITPLTDGRYEVASTSTPDKSYIVKLADRDPLLMDGMDCTCDAVTKHIPPLPYCVHRAAVHVQLVQALALAEKRAREKEQTANQAVAMLLPSTSNTPVALPALISC